MLKKSDDLDIFGKVFDSKMTWEASWLSFQSSFSKAQYLEEVLVSISWLLWKCFQDFILPVLEYFSAVWCSAADSLYYWTMCYRDAWVLTVDVFECNIAHCRSVPVLCILRKIKCNKMHSLHSALPVLYVTSWVTHGALVAHRYTDEQPLYKTLQYHRTFIPFSLSL